MHIVHGALSILQVIISIVLIIIVMMQTSKSEGLGGTIGGQISSTFKGKPGFDDRLSYYTRLIAVVFFACSILVAMTILNR